MARTGATDQGDRRDTGGLQRLDGVHEGDPALVWCGMRPCPGVWREPDPELECQGSATVHWTGVCRHSLRFSGLESGLRLSHTGLLLGDKPPKCLAPRFILPRPEPLRSLKCSRRIFGRCENRWQLRRTGPHDDLVARGGCWPRATSFSSYSEAHTPPDLIGECTYLGCRASSRLLLR